MTQSDALSTALLEALPYINYFAGKTVVIKLGGSTLGSEDTTLQDIVLLKNLKFSRSSCTAAATQSPSG